MLNESDLEAAPSSAHNPLEQFVLLAKSAKGNACAELIRQVLEAPGVYVFGELLDMPNILELELGELASHLHTLRLFAYGTCRQYDASSSQLLALTPVMRRKLQHLTIVSMAVRSKRLPYDDLLTELGVHSVRELEDLVIDAIYADILHGKLDQRKRQLEVDWAIGRDIQPADIGQIAETLQQWSAACETVLQCIEQQIVRANDKKAVILQNRAEIDTEIRHIKESLRVQQNDDEAMAAECSSGLEMRKRMSKAKVVPKPPKLSN